MSSRDPLNFFSPYERLPAGHENQLTRALLLLLRMSPLAHVEWLRLVDDKRSLRALPGARLDTQRRAVRHGDDEVERAELISVFLAPERPQAGGGEVVKSDRGQMLDAIIDYGGELVVVVENKVFEAEDLQAKHINLVGARVQLIEGQEVVIVLWRELLEALSGLRERGLVGGAEAAVLDDFLTYVEDHFPDLGPFRTLPLCQRVPSRVARRLRQVLSDAVAGEGDSSAHGAWVATPAGTVAGKNAYLRVADRHVGDPAGEIELALYPADTLSQAQAFYSRPSAVEGVRRLAGTDGWKAGPNFHFGFMARGYCWTNTNLTLERYLELWQREITGSGTISRDAWDTYWAWLLEHQIARGEDRPEFDRHFTDTARQSATPRPGLWLSRRWPLSEAERLDARNALAAAVNEALDEALIALGEPTPTR